MSVHEKVMSEDRNGENCCAHASLRGDCMAVAGRQEGAHPFTLAAVTRNSSCAKGRTNAYVQRS